MVTRVDVVEVESAGDEGEGWCVGGRALGCDWEVGIEVRLIKAGLVLGDEEEERRGGERPVRARRDGEVLDRRGRESMADKSADSWASRMGA